MESTEGVCAFFSVSSNKKSTLRLEVMLSIYLPAVLMLFDEISLTKHVVVSCQCVNNSIRRTNAVRDMFRRGHRNYVTSGGVYASDSGAALCVSK